MERTIMYYGVSVHYLSISTRKKSHPDVIRDDSDHLCAIGLLALFFLLAPAVTQLDDAVEDRFSG